LVAEHAKRHRRSPDGGTLRPRSARSDLQDHPRQLPPQSDLSTFPEVLRTIFDGDEEIIAFLDIHPLHPGHVLVVPKEHYKNLFYVPEELATRTFTVAKRILPGLRKATGCRAVNLFSPNGADGGQDVFHFHLHLIPVPAEAPFPLQLPDPNAPVPSRSQLDVMATHVMRCIHDEFAAEHAESQAAEAAEAEPATA
jgi:histidine triad (HIT) family protein